MELRCPDCQVGVGQEHDDGCDVARCLETGGQRLSCDPGHDCGNDQWSGFWPGVVDCNHYGWFITADSDYGRKFPHMVGSEDLNYHARVCGGGIAGYRWDREQRRVVPA